MVYKDKQTLIAALGITRDMRVLDIGFYGQAKRDNDPEWPHALLGKYTDHLYGIDLDFDTEKYPAPRYRKASAEDFELSETFDIIFAGDLIEHLSNPGFFLQSCKRHLASKGRLVLTTPNAFSFFSMIEKIMHDEPNANVDHTVYFNKRVLTVLLEKNGMDACSFDYLYSLGTLWHGGWKRKFLASIYWLLAKVTPKFTEDLVVIVAKKG